MLTMYVAVHTTQTSPSTKTRIYAEKRYETATMFMYLNKTSQQEKHTPPIESDKSYVLLHRAGARLGKQHYRNDAPEIEACAPSAA